MDLSPGRTPVIITEENESKLLHIEIQSTKVLAQIRVIQFQQSHEFKMQIILYMLGCPFSPRIKRQLKMVFNMNGITTALYAPKSLEKSYRE